MDIPDGISRLLDHVGLRARAFYAGTLCGQHDFHADEGVGHLHVVRAGVLRAEQQGLPATVIDEPALLFYPRPLDHRLDIAERAAADVVCASVCYDGGMDNAITQSFPAAVMVPFRLAPGLDPILALLFAEAAAACTARQAMLDRLCDVLLIQIVRHAIAHELVANGILAGLTHPQLGKLLVELLEAPGRNWTLDEMSKVAHLSRNTFSRRFTEVVGATPAALLARMRIRLAQRLLRSGKTLARVAEEVGYGSQPALSRAFIRETGAAPSAWVRQSLREKTEN